MRVLDDTVFIRFLCNIFNILHFNLYFAHDISKQLAFKQVFIASVILRSFL